MKKIFSTIVALALAACACVASADASYPFTNPTYIPTAISPAAAYTAPADYTFTTSNISTAVLQVSGTCTSLAGVVQGSSQVAGTPTWVTLNATPVTGGNAVSAISATGTWRVDTAGYAQTRLHITALTASCTVAMSGTSSPPLMAINDPCTSAAVAKSAVLINQSTATTAALVAASTGKSVYVCSFSVSAGGTNPTFTFTSGTQATNPCDTTAALLSGAFSPSATVGVVNYAPNHIAMKTAASYQLCLTTAATTSVQGILSFVQQ